MGQFENEERRAAPAAPDETVRNLARSSARASSKAAEHEGKRRQVPAAPRVLAALSLVMIVASGGYLIFNPGAGGAGDACGDAAEQLAYPREDIAASNGGVSPDDGAASRVEPGTAPVEGGQVGAQGDSAALEGKAPSTSQNSLQGSSGAQAGSSGGGVSTDKPSAQQQTGSSGSNQDDGATTTPAPATVTVTISVDSSAADGSVSSSGTFTFDEGATVYDALCALGLPIGSQQSMHGVYVSSIGGLAEKQFGASSGWVYAVNGKQPSVSCGACALRDGDAIQWRYVIG